MQFADGRRVPDQVMHLQISYFAPDVDADADEE